MEVRSLGPGDTDAAGTILFAAFARAAESRGYPAPWRDARDAADLLRRYHEADPTSVAVADEGGAIVGVGAVRVRGEVATLGPLAVAAEGQGVGGALLDHLLAVGDEAGVAATRLYADAWHPGAFALYTGRGFGVIDVVSHIERAPAPSPPLDSSRGLEVREPAPQDLDEVLQLDRKLTGHDRGADLGSSLRLVARRHGQVVGYLAAVETRGDLGFGPAVAVDVSDLFILVAKALAEAGSRRVRARLSTAAPAASLAALGLGFRIRELGVALSRGALPPARPPQLYGLEPEIL